MSTDHQPKWCIECQLRAATVSARVPLPVACHSSSSSQVFKFAHIIALAMTGLRQRLSSSKAGRQAGRRIIVMMTWQLQHKPMGNLICCLVCRCMVPPRPASPGLPACLAAIHLRSLLQSLLIRRSVRFNCRQMGKSATRSLLLLWPWRAICHVHLIFAQLSTAQERAAGAAATRAATWLWHLPQ